MGADGEQRRRQVVQVCVQRGQVGVASLFEGHPGGEHLRERHGAVDRDVGARRDADAALARRVAQVVHPEHEVGTEEPVDRLVTVPHAQQGDRGEVAAGRLPADEQA